MCLQVLYGLAVGLGVGIDKVIQRFALLVWREPDIATVGKENAIDVVRPEKEITLGRILPGFRSVHRNPADAREIELSPAMVAGDAPIGLRQGNPKMGWATGVCDGGNMDLIREFKRARGRGFSRSRSSRAPDGRQPLQP